MNLAPRYLVFEAYRNLATTCRDYAFCIRQLLPDLRLEAEALKTAESLCAGLLLTHNEISQALKQSCLASESWLLLRLEALGESLANKLFVLQRFTKRLCEEAERTDSPQKFLPALVFIRTALNVLGPFRHAQDSTLACRETLKEMPRNHPPFGPQGEASPENGHQQLVGGALRISSTSKPFCG